MVEKQHRFFDLVRRLLNQTLENKVEATKDHGKKFEVSRSPLSGIVDRKCNI